MAQFKFNNIKIAAIAAAVPSEVVKIDDFVPRFGKEYVDKFSLTTGVKEFRKTKKHQTASDLAFVAATEIISRHKIPKESIGAIIFVTHSTDYKRPATACVLHNRLGLTKNCIAYDINLGCSAFVYGLQSVCSLMVSSDIDRALLLVGETMSKLTNPYDKSVSMLFGDGGAAVLLEKVNDESNIYGILKTDGSGYKSIIIPGGGARLPDITHKDFECQDGSIRNLYNVIMQGEDVFSFTISDVPRTIKEFLTYTNTLIDDYDCLAFHQANQFIHKMLAKKLKCNLSKMPLCIDRYGNTSAAAIPLLLCDTFGSSNIQEPLKCLACGFGVGLSWGVVSFNIVPSNISKIMECDEIYEDGIIYHPDEVSL